MTTFVYRNDGTLAEVKVPDPTQNNTSTVSYTYSFDSLGRPTSLRRPDAVAAAAQSGINITYDGLSQTSTEHLGAAPGSAAVTTTHKDAFGRLVAVDEQLEGMPMVAQATTTYAYGPQDLVAQIVDPENVTTTLTHDLAGRRTSITRGTRTWSYGYDRNSNMSSEEAPCDSQLCGTAYISTTAYDDLDRPSSKLNAPRNLSASDLALFGSSTETFTYDGFYNGKGRLQRWQSFAPGAATPTNKIQPSWNSQGYPYNLEHWFSGAEYSNVYRAYLQFFFPNGTRYAVYTREQVGTQNCTSGGAYFITFDSRGLEDRVQTLSCLYTSGTPSSYIKNTRNVAGLVTKQHSIASPNGPFLYIESNWVYDALGRIKSRTASKGSPLVQVAKQELEYFGNDDPQTLTHWLGATNGQQFDFTFDNRHQLKTVLSTTPGYFSASYDYGAAGRFVRANESASGAPGSNVVPRDVDYQYSSGDPEQVTALLNRTSQLPLRSYSYDASGNQTMSCQGSIAAGVCSGPSLSFVYDGKNQLRRVTKRDASNAVIGSEEYWYDYKGKRTQLVRRDAAGTKTGMRFFMEDTETEFDAAGATTRSEAIVRLGGVGVATLVRDSDAPSNVHYKFQGLADNTLATVDQATGTVNASFIYAPFGEIIEATDGGAPTNGIDQHRRRMNDKYVDELSDLAYYGFRYYDKLSMTWTQSDPLYRFAPDAAWAEPRLAQLYTANLNNPLRYIDPDGRRPDGLGWEFDRADGIKRNHPDIDWEAAANVILSVPRGALGFFLALDDDGDYGAKGDPPPSGSPPDVPHRGLPRTQNSSKQQQRFAGDEKGNVTHLGANDSPATPRTTPQKPKANERRAQEQARSKEQKHGDSEYEEPASEGHARWRAREQEKRKGKDARRDGHDSKDAGEGDRSKKQLEEDYE